LETEQSSKFEVDRILISVVVARRANNKKVGEGTFDAATFYLDDLPDKLTELLETAPKLAYEQWVKQQSAK